MKPVGAAKAAALYAGAADVGVAATMAVPVRATAVTNVISDFFIMMFSLSFSRVVG